MKIAIVGTGNLGSALAGYSGFVNRGFQIVSAYDVSGGKIGRSIGGLEIRPIDRLELDIKEMGVDIVAIVTPAEASQEVADMAVRAGVRALLNFAPVSLHVERGVTVRQVDLATEFQILSYHLANRGEAGPLGNKPGSYWPNSTNHGQPAAVSRRHTYRNKSTDIARSPRPVFQALDSHALSLQLLFHPPAK